MNQQAKKFIDKIIQKAIKERNTKGYRENLGYDKREVVWKFLCDRKDLSYTEESNLMDYFYSECDKI